MLTFPTGGKSRIYGLGLGNGSEDSVVRVPWPQVAEAFFDAWNT